MPENIPTHAAKAVIRDERGRILFVHSNPAVRAVAYWDLPGGLVEPGEVGQAALQRELTEELPNARIKIGQLIGTWSFRRELDGQTVTVDNYSCQLIGGTLEVSSEHDGITWPLKA